MGEMNAGRKAFHFVMVLVGLQEASIAAKREQDYYQCLPIRVEASFGGVLFTEISPTATRTTTHDFWLVITNFQDLCLFSSS